MREARPRSQRGGDGVVAVREARELDSAVVAEFAVHRSRDHAKSDAPAGQDRAPLDSASGIDTATASGSE
jgi:hypothetical protein